MRDIDLSKLESALLESIKQKNTMTESEFMHFIPLFSEGANKQSLKELGDEWATRVSLYDPVNIINSEGKIVRTIPPTLNTIKGLSDIDPKGVLLSAFSKELSIENPVHSHVQEVGELIIRGIKKANDIPDTEDTSEVDASKANWS